MDSHSLARGLGWFSIGLGVAQLLAPREMSRAIGVGDHAALMRLLGMREIGTGLALLRQQEPTPWVEARVVGDVMDLGLLALAAYSANANRDRITGATMAVAGITALDVYCAAQLERDRDHAVHSRRTITINRPAAELYAAWRNFEDLPRFMRRVRSVREIEPNRWRWEAEGPMSRTVKWESEVTTDHPHERIAWRSLPGSDFDNWGEVSFRAAAGNRGTVVTVDMHYRAPAGMLGAKLASLAGYEPSQQTDVDLRAFKQLMETGEIASTRGQPAARRQPRTVERIASALSV